MNISAWAIKKPIPSILLFVVLTLAGMASFRNLGIDVDPNLDIPFVSVTVSQVGAAPEELEIQVTRRIENSVAGLGRIRHITSTVNQGFSVTNIEFELGTNTDRAVNDVRDVVTRVRAELPKGIEEPVVERLDWAGGSFATYVVRAPLLPISELSWLVDDKIATSLLTAKGVGRIEREGGVNHEILVHLEPGKLESVGLTTEAVNSALQNFNINLPGGRADLAGREFTMRTLGSQETLERLKELKVPLPSGGQIALRDLGTVKDTISEPRQRAFFNGQPVVAFSVVRSKGSSNAAVQKAVDAKLEELRPSLPSDVHIEKVRSTASFVHESYLASIEHLILGAILAVIVILYFLRDWRASLICSIAIPLSVIPTFIAMRSVGYTLNSMTLLALALVVGILVDDAIVEIENIVRHIHMGKTPYEASLEAADEIGLAVIATTATIIVVFVPMAFMDGISGQYFGPFGLVVAVSVFFSLVVARLLTPMMAAYLMKVPPKHDGQTFFTRLYRRCLSWALVHRFLTVLGAILFFFAGMGLAVTVPTSLIDATDVGEIVLTASLPPGSRLEDSTRVAFETMALLSKRKEISQVLVTIGDPVIPGASTSQNNVTKATFYLALLAKSERALSQRELEMEIHHLVTSIPGVRWNFSKEDGLSGKLTLVLASREATKLQATAEQVAREMRKLPGLFDIVSGTALQHPELQITPDLDRASELGVSAQVISRTAMVATLGENDANLAKFTLPGRQIPIRVLLDPKYREDLDEIRRLQVPTTSGKLVPLESVAKIELGEGDSQIDRYDRQRQVRIEASIAPGSSLGESLKSVRALPSMRNLPEGIGELPAGDVEVQNEIFAGFAMSMVSAIVLIYIVLVLLFNDFFQPLTIMVSLPLSIGGAFVGLTMANQPLGMFALIGIVMLMGLVTKNAILLVEHGIQARNTGLERTEAMLTAGDTRFRPIMMTTIAMIAGMIPIALGIGAGAEARAPMAVAVIGGLTSSTFLTLIVVPVVYTVVDDIEHILLGQKKEKRQ